LYANPVEVPGPSQAVFNAPFYTCTRNFYVNASTGNDGNRGTQAAPWQSIDAGDAAVQPGDCINVAAGTYPAVNLQHGGNLASASGYVVYRCQTMDACRITTNVQFAKPVSLAANYLVVDGFELDCANNTGFIGIATGTDSVGINAHHLWLLNSIVHDCKQSGLAWDHSDWHWIIHNTFYGNSSGMCGIFGSGLSIWEPQVVAGYIPTAADNAWAPFHIVIEWNVSHDNNNPQTNCTGNTDGNGIILDSWEVSTPPYEQSALVLGNLTYHNGGRGIQVLNTQHATVANNTAYHNNWDNLIIGTFRGEIYLQSVGNSTVINNIAISNTATNPRNTPFLGQLALSATNSWANNISFGAGNNFGAPDSFPATSNQVGVDPMLVNITGGNFALQAGSPAIGYAQPQPFIPSWMTDAGACHSSLTTCP
jgi:hypothetical protein